MTDRDPLTDQLADLIDGSAEPLSPDEVVARARARSPRSRVRPTRRAVAVGLAVTLVVAATVVGIIARGGSSKHTPAISMAASSTTKPNVDTSASTPLPTATYPDSTPVGEMGVIGPGSGWTVNGIAMYRTDDNGAHWRDITPPSAVGQDPIARIGTVDFLDSQHVWAPVSLNDAPFTIYASVNGGSSWQAVCTGNQCPSGQSLTFIDANHGWGIGYTAGNASNFETGELFSTSNGGHTWSRVGPTPFTGPMHFLNQHDGWAVTNPGGYAQPSGLPTKAGGALYRTRAGGQTWQHAQLPAPPGNESRPVAFGVPQFFGRSGVVVGWANSVSQSGPKDQAVVYTTGDGGDTWTVQIAPVDPGANQYGANEFFTAPYFPFSASSASDWMLFLGPNLYVTHDAGQHWSTLTPSPRIGRVYSLALTSGSDAWALAIVPIACHSRAAQQEHCMVETLVSTADGGRTWSAPAPTPSG